MPCRSDYLEANPLEVELSRVLVCLAVLESRVVKGWDGYHKDAYNKATQEKLDKKTAELCGKLKKEKDVTKYSLELQTWWRDHKKADKRHEQEDKEEKRKANLRKAAAKRLTKKQREALGIDDFGDPIPFFSGKK